MEGSAESSKRPLLEQDEVHTCAHDSRGSHDSPVALALTSCCKNNGQTYSYDHVNHEKHNCNGVAK